MLTSLKNTAGTIIVAVFYFSKNIKEIKKMELDIKN